MPRHEEQTPRRGDDGPTIEILGAPAPERRRVPPNRPLAQVIAALVVAGASFAVVSWALGSPNAGPEPQGDLVQPAPSGGSGDLTVSASTLGDRVVIVVTAHGQTAAPWAVAEICATDPPGCSPLWTRSITQDEGSFTAELDVPARFSSPGGGEHDCLSGGCSLRVITSSRSHVFDLGEDAPFAGAARPAPVDLIGPVPDGERRASIVVEPPIVAPGSFITVAGTGLPSSPDRGVAGGWVLCGVRPAGLDDVPASCGTPRIVRTPVIAPDGTFRLVVPAPDPAATRTWIGNRAVDCVEECWLTVLIPGSTVVASAPLALASP